MIRQRVPVGELTRQTVGAMDRLGRAGGRAIKGHHTLIPKDAETVEQVGLFQALKDRENDGIAMARGHRIEEGADLVVTGYLLNATQGLGVRASLAGGESALVRQKRWSVRAEDAQGASGGVLHRGTGVGAGFAVVRKVGDALVQDRLEIIKA